MDTYIALFRGINVGGANRLPMRELVDVLECLGLQNIRTYIHSGNVVFGSKEVDLSELAGRMSAAIKESHGFTPHVLLLEQDELENALASNPFPKAESAPKTLHLFFLASTPENPDLETLESIKRESERFDLRGRVLYLHAPDGIGRSKLAARVEKSLGVPVTARNWRSIGKIMAMARQSD
jgi:uncharacterized protein (DUF1697 family)